MYVPLLSFVPLEEQQRAVALMLLQSACNASDLKNGVQIA
jgi:hypothetical protein